MSVPVAVVLVLALLGVSIGFHLLFYKFGYRHGARDRDVSLQQAYDLGRKAGDNWWMSVEAEIEQERRKLWENERGKKRA